MPNRFRKLTAWLGMLAIWLAIAAPLISQAYARPAVQPEAAICGVGHDAAGVHASGHGAGDHALHLDACGYCAFFAHSPPLGTAAAPIFAAYSAAAALPVFFDRIERSPERHSHAYPRAPPRNA
ncbi:MULTISPECIES: DUF2946 domain-containing protein [Burkholderia]|uniref:DUF2946 domain-containing protein n=1 Tax=Burkholderia TaxID=32008 RepID=UPI0008415781|nr:MULTISPECIES: DUF2946 domain-containing protein [unclassified Burkholderia]AOK31462.1 hypothetical protein AQ611_17965 [Burkholderia sp. Bp7605]